MRKFLIAIAISLNSLIGLQLYQPVFADCPSSNTPKGQVIEGTAATGNDCTENGVEGIFKTVVNVLGIVAGIAAVIMIIVSGFRYITSGGESSKVSAAKSALIYALIGLVIVALSQFLIHFVLTQTAKSVLPECTKSQNPAHDACQ
jgi:cytochrome bd-type quinol oxidase subunit 2